MSPTLAATHTIHRKAQNVELASWFRVTPVDQLVELVRVTRE